MNTLTTTGQDLVNFGIQANEAASQAAFALYLTGDRSIRRDRNGQLWRHSLSYPARGSQSLTYIQIPGLGWESPGDLSRDFKNGFCKKATA